MGLTSPEIAVSALFLILAFPLVVSDDPIRFNLKSFPGLAWYFVKFTNHLFVLAFESESMIYYCSIEFKVNRRIVTFNLCCIYSKLDVYILFDLA